MGNDRGEMRDSWEATRTAPRLQCFSGIRGFVESEVCGISGIQQSRDITSWKLSSHQRGKMGSNKVAERSN
ncbi:hypothetical protein KFK09_004476 [Dendrobium nobile]|uniref:Uncharacterized protein n=1 Tax=Dendrobium nobile TaxID=94219 RepID=A0A8T3C0J9_DENNO|nr:hypothetical protein KFK09_004476 [Dendrobium nobile]